MKVVLVALSDFTAVRKETSGLDKDVGWPELTKGSVVLEAMKHFINTCPLVCSMSYLVYVYAYCF